MNMRISETIKTIYSKIEQIKAQYDLDRQTTKISAVSSGNVSKYESLACKVCFNKKRIARKSCSIENLWIS